LKSENLFIIESFFKNPNQYLILEQTQIYKNMAVIPIILKEDYYLDFITFQEAEKLNLIKIMETGSVGKLKVINNSDKDVLIPFGTTVRGGKQDRTIWEPILIPAYNKNHSEYNLKRKNEKIYDIPAKCIEESRWSYIHNKKFKSTSVKLHPNIAFHAISDNGQGEVWEGIKLFRREMKINHRYAPTNSYLDVSKTLKNKTKIFSKNFTNVKNQCGIIAFINGKLIGLEFYANPNAWKFLNNSVIEAFAIEAIRLSQDVHISQNSINFDEKFNKILKSIEFNFSTKKGIGLGAVIEFNSGMNDWRGISLVYHETMVQFYLIKNSGQSFSKFRGNSIII